MIDYKRRARRFVGIHDVGGAMRLIRHAFLAQRFAPIQRVHGFGVAEHLARTVEVARQRLVVPKLEFAIVRIE